MGRNIKPLFNFTTPVSDDEVRGDCACHGDQIVRDEFAPSWWTLADAAENEADIATTKGRD